MRIEELQKNKKSLYKFILTKESFAIEELELIELIISFTFSNEMFFCFWHYLIGLFSFFKNTFFELDCLNMGCFMSINDKLFLKRLISFLIIKRHEFAITLRGINFNRYFMNK